jgi:hypothetical protein
MEYGPVSGAAHRDYRECSGQREGWGTLGKLHAGKRPGASGTVPEEDDMSVILIEENIINSVRKLLLGRVNEILDGAEFPVPLVEFGGYPEGNLTPSEFGGLIRGGSAACPVIALCTCERSEKERIIRMDAYALTITFALPESPDGEMFCYAYAAAVEQALGEDPALGGVASRAVMTGKKYVPPKKALCGEGWEVILSLRVTVEGMSDGCYWVCLFHGGKNRLPGSRAAVLG